MCKILTTGTEDEMKTKLEMDEDEAPELKKKTCVEAKEAARTGRKGKKKTPR